MRRWKVLLGVLVFTVAAARLGRWVARGGPFARSPAAAAPRYEEGEILRVDLERRELVLRASPDDARELRVAVDAATQIRYRDQALALAQVQPGDHATVRLRPPTQGSGRIAETIRLARPALQP